MTRSPRVVWVEEQVKSLPRQSRLLDVGFVGAYQTPFLHLALCEQNPELLLVGMDVDVDGLTRHKVSNSLAGDGYRLPFRDDAFDVLLFLEVLEHVYQPERMFKEFTRVLRPEGKLILTTPNAWSWNRMARFWLCGSMKTRTQRQVYRGYLAAPDHVRFYEPLSLMNVLYDHEFETQSLVTKNHSIPFLSRFLRPLFLLDLQFWPMNRLGSYICLVARNLKQGNPS